MSSEEDDVLSMSDDLGNDEAEPDDNDDNINIYSSDSSPHNTFKHFNIAREHPFATSRHSVLPNLPKELELRPQSSGGLNQPQQTFISVWARNDLKLGTIFGPYQGKIRKDPITTSFNWKVTDRTATFTAWLELLDFNAIQWITCMRKADYAPERNAILLLFRGQLYIELTREVNKGSELQLLSTEVLLIHEDPNGKRDKAEGSLLNDLFVSTTSSLSNCGPLFESLSPNKLFNFSNPINSKSEIVSTLNQSTSSKTSQNNQNSRLEDAHPSSSSDATIKCSLCDNHFPDQLRLNEHVLFSHCNEDSGGGDREYKCNQCPKVFNWKSNLIRHQVAHDDSRRYTCENCKKVFTDPSNLQRHIRSQHIGARSHACPDCGKTFATSSGLKQHTHIHSSVKPFRCEVCFKAYTQFSNLCRHKRMHATCRLQIKCNKCGQAFSTVTSLSKHKRFCEGTSPSSNASLSPSSRNVNHINLNLSPNLSSPDSSVRKDSHLSSLDITSPLNQTNPNPFLVYSRPGFPFYPPFFGSSFPSIFPGSGTPISPASSGPIINTNNSINNNNQLSSDLFSLSNKQQTPETEIIKNSKDFEVKNSENIPRNSLTDSSAIESNRKKEKQEVVSNSSESLATDSEQSDLEESDEEVAVTGDSDTEDERINIKPKEVLIKKEINSLKIESEFAVTENIMSNNRESSPKQGAVCPEQMISSNGFIRPLSMMVDHLHSDLPFDLSRNNNKSQRRLLEDSPEFKSKIREESGDEPLDLTIKHKKENISSHLMAPNNYGELFARHRAMFMAESMQSREEKRSHSPTGHIYNHHKLAEHFQRPLSPSKLMAYPRPIHPMILESMYRMQMEHQQHQQQQHQQHQQQHQHKAPNTPAFPMFGDPQRLSAAFPAFPPRYPPMLSPALLGTPAAQATFDFMRAHMNDKIKPQSELMSPQMIKAKERYTCKFCGKVFPRSANLTRHLRTHTGEQPYKCKYCERSFSISSNLQRHVRNIHNKEKPFKCPLCDRCFGQQTNLDRHLKKHESDGPTILDDSPKIESDKDNGDAYFNEIRTFMGKVTDRSITDKSIRSMISPNSNNQKVYLPKTNGNNDENEIIADEESDIDESVPKKSRLHSDTSSIIEDDVVMSEDNEDADSVTDEESSTIPSENGNSRTSPSRSPPVGARTRANISSVVACLSKKAQQKLNGLNGCGKSDEENKSENGMALTAGH